MKLTKKAKRIFASLLFAAFALFVWAGISPPVSLFSAEAYTYDDDYVYDPYAYTVERYTVEMDVADDCTINVREVITVHFEGHDSHGIIRDFPLGGHASYSDLTATCDHPDFSPYFTTDEAGVLSWYLRGGRRTTGEERTYTLTYTLHADTVDGALPLDVLPYGIPADILDFQATVRLPKGYLDCEVYSGRSGTENNDAKVVIGRTADGDGTIITFSGAFPRMYKQDGARLAYGVTLNFLFEEGALSPRFDLTIVWALLIALGLMGLALLLRFFVCRPHLFTRTVNLTAPENMDPLLMGKIIDGKVDGEDMGALVFWLASEGYLTIDFSENDEDPILRRTQKALPENAPMHIKLFLEGLFNTPKARESGRRVSEISNNFYTTADRVKANVNFAAGKLYEDKSVAVPALLGILSVLLLGGFSLLYGLLHIGAGYYSLSVLVASAAAFAAGIVPFRIAERVRYKWKLWKRALLMAGALVLGAGIALFSLLFPNAAFVSATGAILVAAAVPVGAIAGLCCVRTRAHSEQLGQILGFKDFILYTERDKIAFMLKENPELYYRILPYAQVLGVTSAWTDKFKDLNLPAPSWAYYNSGMSVFDIIIWHSVFRSMTHSLARTMVSRPHTHGSSPFGGGHGGRGGGGFGGGGMRGC